MRTTEIIGLAVTLAAGRRPGEAARAQAHPATGAAIR